MRDLRQTPILRVEWQARPGERELRRAQNGARGFDPVGREPLERGAKGGEHCMSERDKAEYRQMVERRTPRSHFVRDTWRAFWVGGLICALSEGCTLWLMRGFNFARQDAATLTSVTLVFITAALTAIGVFDRIGRYAGGGTIVPITGFANSIASAAMEYRSEGFIMGVGARMFQIAGPVLVYGIGSSVVVGIIYYIIDLIWGI